LSAQGDDSKGDISINKTTEKKQTGYARKKTTISPLPPLPTQYPYLSRPKSRKIPPPQTVKQHLINYQIWKQQSLF
jgi:hypothetical protein